MDMGIHDTETTPELVGEDFDIEAAEGLSDEGHIAAAEEAAGHDVDFDPAAAAGLSDDEYRAAKS